MVRGPKPKPTQFKVLHGNPGKRPLNEREPQPESVVPDCPEHLDAEAQREWARISVELHAMGVIAKVDRAALAAYCTAWGRWVKAEGALAKSGEILKSKKTEEYYQNPYLAVANRAMKQMKEFLVEFGMTPSSRTRLQVGPMGHEADELETFLKHG